ncbi:short-chain dehydrogenase [Pedobacter yulinensis]|uniref:Short-chain dehydrogenase n=1 Tax=Pedobacter yulinensis TaxID=2126353 RepID=A0A2T3HKU8_9SPHI|nr:SDR family oxidoreductase [Pedobacter yulinensis]PST83072.1 short-chain dehydrogenase [Pedobacter yulinensis]
MDLNLKDKVFIVTGGAKGIGASIVSLLAAEGALPIIVGRNEADNAALTSHLTEQGQRAAFVTAELNEPARCAGVIAETLRRFGRIDGLVNNAGQNDGVGLEDGSYEAFMASLHKSLIHYYLLAQHALPALKLSKGSILNISSKTAETGQGGTSGYAAANGGRNALTREWAVELLPYGIRVNAIVVSECWTPQYETWVHSFADGAEKLEEITRRIPLGQRMTSSEEIANAAVFLLSERSSHTTGQLLHVDGGYVHLDRAIR